MKIKTRKEGRQQGESNEQPCEYIRSNSEPKGWAGRQLPAITASARVLHKLVAEKNIYVPPKHRAAGRNITLQVGS